MTFAETQGNVTDIYIISDQAKAAGQLNAKDAINVRGFIMADESVCLDSPTVSEVDDEATVRYQACNEVAGQIWLYDETTLNVIHVESSKCLTHPKAGTSDILNLKVCQEGNQEQMWEMISEEWKNI